MATYSRSMEKSRVRDVDLPLILRYVEGVVEDCPVNAHVVVDDIASDIVGWVKGSSFVTTLRL